MFHCLRSPVDIWAKWAKCGVAGRDRGREGSMDLPHSKIQNQNIRRKHGYSMVRLTIRVNPPQMAIFHLKTCCLQKSCCCSILVPLSSWQHGKIDRWLNLIESRFSPLAAVQLQPWSSFVPVTADDPTQPLPQCKMCCTVFCKISDALPFIWHCASANSALVGSFGALRQSAVCNPLCFDCRRVLQQCCTVCSGSQCK